jgi:hypothetical protein
MNNMSSSISVRLHGGGQCGVTDWSADLARVISMFNGHSRSFCCRFSGGLHTWRRPPRRSETVYRPPLSRALYVRGVWAVT